MQPRKAALLFTLLCATLLCATLLGCASQHTALSPSFQSSAVTVAPSSFTCLVKVVGQGRTLQLRIDSERAGETTQTVALGPFGEPVFQAKLSSDGVDIHELYPGRLPIAAAELLTLVYLSQTPTEALRQHGFTLRTAASKPGSITIVEKEQERIFMYRSLGADEQLTVLYDIATGNLIEARPIKGES